MQLIKIYDGLRAKQWHNFFWRTKQICASKAFYSNPKDRFFIVSDVMENGATNIKTNTAHFIAMKYSDTEK